MKSAMNVPANEPGRSNPYLSGNFAPLASEDDFAGLNVAGEIPAELRGTYYRNGPNPQFPPRDAFYHWFAGDGMIHAFRVEEGKVAYKNRFVPTPKYGLEKAAGQALFGTFGNPMTSDPSVLGKDSGVANTNIVWHGGRLLALEEGHQPFELDPRTLEGRGYRDYSGKYGRFTAHPKIDPETGELIFFGYMVGEMPFSNGLCFGIADRDGKITRLDGFEAPFASMIHDFFVTRNYAMFPVLPLTGSLERAMKGQMPFAWEPGKGAYVGVMRRDAPVSSIRWFQTDPCYVFHPMNMWEDGDRLIVDAMEYARAPLFPNADGSMGENAPAFLSRWTIDLANPSDSFRRSQIDDMAGEFPRLDERRAGLSYRHGWFAATTRSDGKVVFDSIAHVDHRTGTRTAYHFAPGEAPGEPVFVPRHAASAEGDGFLVTTLYRAAEDRSDFVVFDAQNIAQGPIGSAQLPRRVPFGFHGNWAQGV